MVIEYTGSLRYGMGRLEAQDRNDKKFPMQLALPPRTAVSQRIWKIGEILNQGHSSTCVGHAWTQWSMTDPIMDNLAPDPFDVYMRAQLIDEFPGEEPIIFGTSVRAGAKIMQQLGYIESYHWAFSAEDVKRWVLARGPVVLGTTWYSEMFVPSPAGFVQVKGEESGGHAYLCNGYDNITGAFQCTNSWGLQWGINGQFWLAGEDLEKLLRRAGEACAAIERRL